MVNEPERYCSRQYLKNALGIPADETDHDPKLNECIAESQVVVDNALTPYDETTPIPADSFNFEQVREAAKTYAEGLWYEFYRQDRLATNKKDRFAGLLKTIIDTYMANKTSRTTSKLIVSDPRKNKLIIPSQVETAVLGYDT